LRGVAMIFTGEFIIAVLSFHIIPQRPKRIADKQ
jgi:hypothetical protein